MVQESPNGTLSVQRIRPKTVNSPLGAGWTCRVCRPAVGREDVLRGADDHRGRYRVAGDEYVDV